MSINIETKVSIRFCSILVFVFVLIHIRSFANNTKVSEEAKASALIVTLQENGINLSTDAKYETIISTLQTQQINVPDSHRGSALKYLSGDNASSLIGIPTSKPGILAWHFENVMFLRKDLVFARYSDGEMYGGDIRIKVFYENDQIVTMKTLWNYH